METTPVIYAIENRINHKVYIGSATHFDKRCRIHLYYLNKNKHHSKHLQAAWNKYGADAFYFHVLEYVNCSNMLKREQWWLDTVQPFRREVGYNISPTAGNISGTELSYEAKRQISDRMRKIWASPDGRKKMSDSMKEGWDAEARQNKSVASQRMWTPERKRRQSERMKQIWARPEEKESRANLMKEAWASETRRQNLSNAAKQVWSKRKAQDKRNKT